MVAIEIGTNQTTDAPSRAKDASWVNERRILGDTGDATIPCDFLCET